MRPLRCRGSLTRRRTRSTQPTTLLALGAIGSYLLVAIGWILYGVAIFRARVFPTAISVAIVIGGAIGFQTLLSPWGVPLGLAVGAPGIWMSRTKAANDGTGGHANASKTVFPQSA